VYWFEHTNDAAQRFLPHLVDDESGVGRSFAVEDVNADGKVDIFATTNAAPSFTCDKATNVALPVSTHYAHARHPND
jgi:hypothetical protein